MGAKSCSKIGGDRIQFFGDDSDADLNRRFNNNDRQGLYGREYVLLGCLGVLGAGWGALGWLGGYGRVLGYIRITVLTVQLLPSWGYLERLAGMTSFSDRTTR